MRGGIYNYNGGISNTGQISGATDVFASGTVSAGAVMVNSGGIYNNGGGINGAGAINGVTNIFPSGTAVNTWGVGVGSTALGVNGTWSGTI